MALVRAIVLLLLLAAAACFGLYAATGNPKYRRYGITILKWTLLAALGFFAVLFIDRLSS